jgi:nicotinamidase-related amidase
LPITALDPQTALVVIDMQKGIVAMPTAHPAHAIVENVVALTTAFRRKSHPVVLVHVGWSADSGDTLKNRVQAAPRGGTPPADFSDYIPELAADPAHDIFIRKRQWGAFYGTDLDLQLRRRRVTNIVLCGIATSIGVESTARDAWERGYNVTFASDAMTDLNLNAHERALEIIFPRIGEIGTTADVTALLG